VGVEPAVVGMPPGVGFVQYGLHVLVLISACFIG